MKIRVSWFDEYRNVQSAILSPKVFLISRYGITMTWSDTFSLHAYWDELEDGFDILNY